VVQPAVQLKAALVAGIAVGAPLSVDIDRLEYYTIMYSKMNNDKYFLEAMSFHPLINIHWAGEP
jgi:hypothetical protein